MQPTICIISIQNTEKEAIIQALLQTNGNKAKAARLLNIDRSSLYYKLKKYFDTCKEGYVEYLFKYKDGKYLAIYDFLELPEPVIIKFDDLIVGYTDEDINK